MKESYIKPGHIEHLNEKSYMKPGHNKQSEHNEKLRESYMKP